MHGPRGSPTFPNPGHAAVSVPACARPVINDERPGRERLGWVGGERMGDSDSDSDRAGEGGRS